MLVIRLFRIGKKNQPYFKLVVTDKRNSSRTGRFVEEVGSYNPSTKEKILKGDRIKYWLSQGVQPSPTVYNMLVKEGITEGKKIAVHKKSPPQKGEARPTELGGKKAPVPAAAPAAPAPATPAPAVAAETPKEEKKEEPVAPEGPIAQR